MSAQEPRQESGTLHHSNTQAYYDEFSKAYEKNRGDNDPGGYHELIDDLQVDFASRYAAGGDLLEVGCGTGLLLRRFAKLTKSARAIDLSPGILEKARARGLDVRTGTVFADFYNPYSLRGIVKRWGPAGAISASTKESAVYTRFDSPFRVGKLLPPGWRVTDSRGVRILTPAAQAFRVPWLRKALTYGEWALAA
jgi:SAM-dependent methyltransferase